MGRCQFRRGSRLRRGQRREPVEFTLDAPVGTDYGECARAAVILRDKA
jgi:hypothetical protein